VTPTKLLIVDDHQVFAEGLEALFRAKPDFEPLPAISDPDQVISTVRLQRPDAVIMDVQLGDVSGIELTTAVMALPDPPVVVVLTGYSDAATAIGAIQAGAMGFVSKDGPADHIVTAVRAAMLGGTWFPAGLLGLMLTTTENAVTEPFAPSLGQLTDREREVLRLMVSGLDRKTIATRLHRSPDTVKTHIRNIAAKLGTRSATEAVAMALSAGLRPELSELGARTLSSCPDRPCPGARSRSTRAARTGSRMCSPSARLRPPRPARCPAGTCSTAGTTSSSRCPRCQLSGCP
jgi:DNA-binding NarL/FixJ family response regulator